MSRRRNSEKKYRLLAFGLSVFLCGLPFLRGLDISIISDEIGAFATAPFLAGYDWSYAVANSHYYGFGYYWLAFVLLKITDNYMVLYLGITTINFLLCCSMSILIFYILTKEFGIQDKYIAAIVAAICTTFRHNTFGIANEYPLFVTVWLICWALLKVFCSREDTKQNTKYTIIVAALCIYALTVHERMLALWMALVIVIIVFRFLARLQILNEKVLGICLLLGYSLQRFIRKIIVENIWLLEEGQKITNMSAISAKNFSALMSWDTLRATADCMLTNLYKAAISSYGLAIAAILVAIGGLVYTIKMRIKRQILTMEEFDDSLKKSYLIIWVFGLTMLIVMAGLATKGASSISEGYKLGQETPGYKHFFYLRYYQPFIGPVFAATYAVMERSAHVLKRYVKLIILSCLLIFVYFCCNIFPQILNTRYFADRRNLAPIVTRWLNSLSYGAQWFNVIATFILLLIFCILLFKFDNKKCQMIFLVLILSVVIRNASLTWNAQVGEVGCSQAGASYEFMQSIEDYAEMPKKIYCMKGVYTFQFVLNRYSVRLGIPDEQDESAIVFADEDLSNQDEMEGYCYIQLDDNEYVYVKGDKLISYVSQQYSMDLCGE